MISKGSSAKRHKQSETRRLRNKSRKSEVKTSIRKFLEAVESGDREVASRILIDSQKLLDSATQKGVYHRNTTSRKKSRLTHILNKMSASAEQA